MKLKNIFVISILCLSFTACQSFLEVEDEGRSSIPVFFSDMDGVRAALPGAYSRIYKYYDSEFLLYPDVAGDMLEMTIAVSYTHLTLPTKA